MTISPALLKEWIATLEQWDRDGCELGEASHEELRTMIARYQTQSSGRALATPAVDGEGEEIGDEDEF